MTPEGRLTIDLSPSADSVKIVSTRPLTIPRQFSGQRPEQVIRSVSLLFATCRDAQSIASAEAFEQALGLALPENTKRARALLILAETAREHALRVLMDWPLFLRSPEEPQAPTLQRLMQTDRDLRHSLAERGGAIRVGGVCAIETDAAKSAIAKLAALLEHVIYGESLDRWRARTTLAELTDWMNSARTGAQRLVRQLVDDGLGHAGAAQVSPLPALQHGPLAERLLGDDAEEFIAKPDWEGSPRETSPLTRNKDHALVDVLKCGDGYGVAARLMACLAELATIPARMLEMLDTFEEADATAQQTVRGGGTGVAQIEAARGRLVHAVQMADGKVGCYRILAPTEWNFHPEGAAARGLARIAAAGGGDCATLARLFVTAADPCVACDVRVR